MRKARVKSQRYTVSTRNKPDEDVATGLVAACALALERANSSQTRAVVKNAKTGRVIGSVRVAPNKNDVIGRGRCRTR